MEIATVPLSGVMEMQLREPYQVQKVLILTKKY